MTGIARFFGSGSYRSLAVTSRRNVRLPYTPSTSTPTPTPTPSPSGLSIPQIMFLLEDI